MLTDNAEEKDESKLYLHLFYIPIVRSAYHVYIRINHGHVIM